jgi:hypothetical protein
MPALGTDIAGVVDVDAYLSVSNDGPRAAAEAVAAGLLHPAGTLWWSPESGFSLPDQLHRSASTQEILAGVEQQCLRDERVVSAEVTANKVGGDLSLSVALELTNGDTADLTLTVDAFGEVLSATAT